MSRFALFAGAGATSATVAAAAVYAVQTGLFAPNPPAEDTAAVPVVAEQPAAPEAVAQTETSVEAVEPQVNDAPAITPPSFDVVQVEASGQTLIAGRAMAGMVVEIALDGAALGALEADSGGDFVGFFDIQPASTPRVLTLAMMVDEARIEGASSIIIAPVAPAVVAEAAEPETPEAPEAQTETVALAAPALDSPAVAITEPADTGTSLAQPEFPEEEAPETAEAPVVAETQPASPAVSEDETSLADAAPVDVEAPAAADAPTATETAATETAATEAVATTAEDETATDPAPAVAVSDPDPDVVETASAEAEEPTAPETPTAPTVLAQDEEGLRVIQAPQVVDTIALDTISYDAAGEVALAGRASEGFVRVYLDNTPVTSSRIRPDGSWRVDLPEVDRGVYTLRVDEVDEAGTVTSRVETPFQREDRAALAAADEESAAEVRVLTVQPGNTLWALARERYGEGTLYVRLFEANRDRIRDPDLIYPGQVFDLPE
ncbi:LysM peptidoglycan-binding domain-containing protein [Roseobacteraceae bacterium S113]